MQRILVTGSSGQLGREIVKLLKRHHYKVVGIDLLPSDTTDECIDITNKDSVTAITRSTDAVIHTAALHGKHYVLDYPRADFIHTNIQGTFNLLNACVKQGIAKFIYTSTTSIYGKAMVNENQAVWVTEQLTPDPRDIYDITKLTAELLCRDFFEKEQIEATILRVSRFLPETDNLKAVHRLYRGLSEEDGANAHLLALQKVFTDFEIFNISNESPFKETDLRDLYHNPKKVIAQYYPNVESIFEAKGWQFPEKIDRVYVIKNAKEKLGYQPQHNFDSFLK